MITKETARKIFAAHTEIENSYKLLEEVKETIKKTGTLEFASGWDGSSVRGCEFSIPNGPSGSRLFRVNAELSLKVIEQHIADKTSELKELEAIAKIELAATK